MTGRTNTVTTDDLATALVTPLSSLTKLFTVLVQGFKSFYLPAEPYFNVFSFTLTASQALNNQAADLKLPWDFYVYGIARQSTGTFSFLLKGSGGGVFFGNAQVRSDALWSANEPVLWLRRPFKIAALASLSIDLTDLSAAGNTGQIIFVGWKAASQYSSGQASA